MPSYSTLSVTRSIIRDTLRKHGYILQVNGFSDYILCDNGSLRLGLVRSTHKDEPVKFICNDDTPKELKTLAVIWNLELVYEPSRYTSSVRGVVQP